MALERELARAVELSRRERARLALARYLAVAGNASQVPYLGKEFSYDNRLLPILLPAYLSQIRHLQAAVALAEIRTVVDVGANVGQFAATLLRQHPEARVWSFEPNTRIFPLLAQNASRHAHWQTVPVGVAASDEEVDLWVVDGKSGQGSVLRDNALAGMRGAQPSQQRVVMQRLTDARLQRLGIPSTVDVLKIDVEGAEASALMGLADLAGASWSSRRRSGAPVG